MPNERTPEKQAINSPITITNTHNKGLIMHNPKKVYSNPIMTY